MAKKKTGKKLWAGRSSGKLHRLAEEFNASIGFDSRLAPYDIEGSVIHAELLKKAGILKSAETQKIKTGLKKIAKEMSSGKFRLKPVDEDIHMAVERRLTELIGPLGGKLHTARSRNDQVALDLRLYLREETVETLRLLDALLCTLADVAEANLDCIMPGYTHLQRAQPVLFSHYILAYYEMLKRDEERLLDAYSRCDTMPLGSGALAGSPYRLDRKLAARLLGFTKITENSIDAVSDRDFALEFMAAASIMAMHLTRLAEELINWSSSEFGFVEMADAFSTGSSIMPQKKNPDIAELIRAKSGRVYGNLTALLTVMKSLPLAYDKDMQEDKEPLFDTVDTVKAVLEVLSPMLSSMRVNKERMAGATRAGFLTATDAADYLTNKGVPFRESHNTVGKVVAYCIKKGKHLEELSIEEWQSFSEHFDKDIRKIVRIEASVSSRKVRGGTAPSEVKRRLKEIREELKL